MKIEKIGEYFSEVETTGELLDIEGCINGGRTAKGTAKAVIKGKEEIADYVQDVRLRDTM